MASNFVLGSGKSSTGTRPPHHSAARTDLVLLIRRTVRPRGYALDLHLLRPRWTTVLNTLLLLQQPSHFSLQFAENSPRTFARYGLAWTNDFPLSSPQEGNLQFTFQNSTQKP